MLPRTITITQTTRIAMTRTRNRFLLSKFKQTKKNAMTFETNSMKTLIAPPSQLRFKKVEANATRDKIRRAGDWAILRTPDLDILGIEKMSVRTPRISSTWYCASEPNKASGAINETTK